jgi:hypothetical protein
MDEWFLGFGRNPRYRAGGEQFPRMPIRDTDPTRFSGFDWAPGSSSFGEFVPSQLGRKWWLQRQPSDGRRAFEPRADPYDIGRRPPAHQSDQSYFRQILNPWALDEESAQSARLSQYERDPRLVDQSNHFSKDDPYKQLMEGPWGVVFDPNPWWKFW